MSHAIRISFAVAISIVAGNSRGDESPAPPEGFQAIFNGKDLSGWEGSPEYWSVKDGCLTGVTDGTLKYNRFIIWRGGTLKNFELRVKVKVTPGGNSGLNYRSQHRPDLGDARRHRLSVRRRLQSGRLQRHALRGTRPPHPGPHGRKSHHRCARGSRGSSDKLPVKEFKAGEWHDFRVLVRGNHHQHWIDGHPTVDVIDLDEKNRTLEGILGVQVHVGPAMQIQYRDFFVKHLPDDLPIIAPEQATIPASAVKVVPQGTGKKK